MAKLKRGKPRHSITLKKNAGHALSQEVLTAIEELPQIKTKACSKSYLAEQLWRNFLGLTSDYDLKAILAIAKGKII